MSIPSHSLRPLAPLKRALRQCRAERCTRRLYATQQQPRFSPLEDPAEDLRAYPIRLDFRKPPEGFRTSQTTKQNRYNTNLRKLPTPSPPRSHKKICPDPVAKVNADQIALLDPTGARTRLFSPENPDRVRPGDILHVRLKNENPVNGVCLSIRQRHQPVDTAILLRNQLTRIGVEMWVKVYSPNVEGIEIVQRKEKRARRARLYYMRLPKHDVGSVDGTVNAYLRQKAGPIASSSVKARDANAHNKKSNKKKGR